MPQQLEGVVFTGTRDKLLILGDVLISDNEAFASYSLVSLGTERRFLRSLKNPRKAGVNENLLLEL